MRNLLIWNQGNGQTVPVFFPGFFTTLIDDDDDDDDDDADGDGDGDDYSYYDYDYYYDYDPWSPLFSSAGCWTKQPRCFNFRGKTRSRRQAVESIYASAGCCNVIGIERNHWRWSWRSLDWENHPTLGTRILTHSRVFSSLFVFFVRRGFRVTVCQYDSCTLRLSSAVGGAPVFDSISEFRSVGFAASWKQWTGGWRYLAIPIFPHFPQKEHDPLAALAQCLWVLHISSYHFWVWLTTKARFVGQCFLWSQSMCIRTRISMHKRDNLIREYLHEWRVETESWRVLEHERIRWHLDWAHPAQRLVKAKGWQRKRQTWQGYLVHACAGKSLQCQLEESVMYQLAGPRLTIGHMLSISPCYVTIVLFIFPIPPVFSCFLASCCVFLSNRWIPPSTAWVSRYSFPCVSSRRGFFFCTGGFRQMFLPRFPSSSLRFLKIS